MPLNANILSLLRQQNPANSQPMAKGVDPNLEMILQAMGMMPRQLDMQGRPILSGVKNPSTMDQHYARQANPEAMKDRYSSPTFAMGANDPNRMAPATKLPGQGPIVAHQPVTGLPGQVGPAYSTQMTPINMSPSADENAAMDAVRQQYRETMFTKTQPQMSPWRPNDQMSQRPPDTSFGVPKMPTVSPVGHGVAQNPLFSPAADQQFAQAQTNDRQQFQTQLNQDYQAKLATLPSTNLPEYNPTNWDVQNATPSLPEMFQYLTGVGKPWQPKVVPGRANPGRYSSLNR